MITTPMLEDFSDLASDEENYSFLQNQRIYITGATGQIGWYLLHFLTYLIDTGRLVCQLNAHIRNYERLVEKYPDHTALPCRFIIEKDAATFLGKEHCNLVIHCASKASPKHFAASPVDVMEANSIVTHSLLEQLRIYNPLCHFVYLSTTGVTGYIPDDQRPSPESQYGPLDCTNLSNCYLESKRFGEMLSLAYFHQYKIPVSIIRPSITYGPGFDLDDGRSYADFVSSLLLKKPIKLTSDGSAVRNFLYISDFISGLLLVIRKAPAGSVFNVASPSPISILELATILNESIFDESLGAVERCTNEEPQLTRVEFKSTDASVDSLKKLGWRQKNYILDGFKKTTLHYMEQNHEY